MSSTHWIDWEKFPSIRGSTHEKYVFSDDTLELFSARLRRATRRTTSRKTLIRAVNKSGLKYYNYGEYHSKNLDIPLTYVMLLY